MSILVALDFYSKLIKGGVNDIHYYLFVKAGLYYFYVYYLYKI